MMKRITGGIEWVPDIPLPKPIRLRTKGEREEGRYRAKLLVEWMQRQATALAGGSQSSCANQYSITEGESGYRRTKLDQEHWT